MRCSSIVCPFQWVWGAFYRQGRSVKRVGLISQVRPDQGVRPALWSTASLIHPSCASRRGGALDQARATGQGRPHLPSRPHLQGRSCLVVRPCLARVAHWFQFLPKCVHAYEIHNTTHGTLLVLKMWMKLAVYSSRTWGFDGQIFVVRTVNKLPQAKCLLVLEETLDSASAD
jgi:hypothetical protein